MLSLLSKKAPIDLGVDIGEDINADNKVKLEGGIGGVRPIEDGMQLPRLPDIGPPYLRGYIAAGAVEVLHSDARYSSRGINAIVAASGA